MSKPQAKQTAAPTPPPITTEAPISGAVEITQVKQAEAVRLRRVPSIRRAVILSVPLLFCGWLALKWLDRVWDISLIAFGPLTFILFLAFMLWRDTLSHHERPIQFSLSSRRIQTRPSTLLAPAFLLFLFIIALLIKNPFWSLPFAPSHIPSATTPSRLVWNVAVTQLLGQNRWSSYDVNSNLQRAGDKLLVSKSNAPLLILNAQNGAEISVLPNPSNASGKPFLSKDGKLVFTTQSLPHQANYSTAEPTVELIAQKVDSGNIVWQRTTGAVMAWQLEQERIFTSRVEYKGQGQWIVEAISSTDGHLLWQQTLTFHPGETEWSKLTLGGDTLYLLTKEHTRLIALDVNSGAVRWENNNAEFATLVAGTKQAYIYSDYDKQGDIIIYTPDGKEMRHTVAEYSKDVWVLDWPEGAVADNNLILAYATSNSVVSINPDGTLHWHSYQHMNDVRTITIAENKIYLLIDEDNWLGNPQVRLIALDANNGEQLWRSDAIRLRENMIDVQHTDAPIDFARTRNSNIVVDNGMLYFTYGDQVFAVKQ